MPEISRFYGIIIRMYFGDHAPSHFHAIYGRDEVVIGIDSLAVLHGRVPARAQGLVVEWASLHQTEPREAWSRAERSEPLGKIDPLD